MNRDDRSPPPPARPLDRSERGALAALADQIDREAPALALQLRGVHRAAHGPDRRGGVQLTLFALVLLVVAAGMAASVAVWGNLGLAASAGALVAILGVMTLGAACR